MPIDLSTRHGTLLRRLVTELDQRRDHYTKLESYYRGTNGIPVHSNKAVSQSYRRLMAVSGLNLARLTVEATRERLQISGIRTALDPSDVGDNVAWRIWQANSLDADHMQNDRATLTMGRSYAMVSPFVDPEIGAPTITFEDPRQCITVQSPNRRRKAVAGLKVWVDGDHDRIAFFPEPGWVLTAERRRMDHDTTRAPILDLGQFDWSGDPVRLPLPVVPIVEFTNQAGINGDPEGEFEPHLATLDRIAFNVLNRMELLTLQAFKQRAIKGLPLRDPATGEEIDYSGDFLAGPGELWQLPETAEIWESTSIDLQSIILAERHDIATYAGATATPLSYLLPDDGGGSAEGAWLKRESAVLKALDRQAQQGESYEELMSLALMVAGEVDRADRGGIEIIWNSPERHSLAAQSEAVAKFAAGGIPLSTIARSVLQMSPMEIERLMADQSIDALLNPDAAVA